MTKTHCVNGHAYTEESRYALPDGRGTRCKPCATDHMKAQWRRYKYGISHDEYDALLKEQNGLCAICGRPDRLGKSLAVDHDHKTKLIRGLLCQNCNQAIGLLDDSIDLLLAAVQYLDRK